MNLVYCDYIAHVIVSNLKANDTDHLLSSVSRPELDLTNEGSFQSTKKNYQGQRLFWQKIYCNSGGKMK